MTALSVAETVSICEEQEKLLVFSEFSTATAWQIGSIIRLRFLADPSLNADRDIVIQIKLFSGHVLFVAAVGMHDPCLTGPDNYEWVKGKENVVRRFGMSSLRYYKNCIKREKPFGADNPEYVAAGGAFPIRIKDLSTGPIGTIIVSGMPDTADHQIIADSLAEFLGLEGQIKSVM